MNNTFQEKELLADGSKHTATIDPARWIEEMANGYQEPSDMLDEIRFIPNADGLGRRTLDAESPNAVTTMKTTKLKHPSRCLARPVQRPIGRVPANIKAWLEVNEAWTGWKIAVCKCGKWYHLMDHLAPYHTEMNWCKKCGYQCPPNSQDQERR